MTESAATTSPLRAASAEARLAPVLALVLNAFVWGVSWWPFRLLESRGIHPLWATALIYAFAAITIVAVRPGSLRELVRTPELWLIAAAAGATNASFNWGVTIGDVVRVVLLFYLMPLWAVLLGRWILGERTDAAGWLRVLLALAGAALVLWPQGGGLPLPTALHEWLGLFGGFSFALNNVMLRREGHRPAEARALAMFMGGLVVAGASGVFLAQVGRIGWPAGPDAATLGVAMLLCLGFLVSNLSAQYGAARLPVNVTAVVMISEVAFAAGSAALLGRESPDARTAVGGALILAAAALAAVRRPASDQG